MQSTKSEVSRVPGLPAKLISVPEEYIRGCHVLTVTITYPNPRIRMVFQRLRLEAFVF